MVDTKSSRVFCNIAHIFQLLEEVVIMCNTPTGRRRPPPLPRTPTPRGVGLPPATRQRGVERPQRRKDNRLSIVALDNARHTRRPSKLGENTRYAALRVASVSDAGASLGAGTCNADRGTGPAFPRLATEGAAIGETSRPTEYNGEARSRTHLFFAVCCRMGVCDNPGDHAPRVKEKVFPVPPCLQQAQFSRPHVFAQKSQREDRYRHSCAYPRETAPPESEAEREAEAAPHRQAEPVRL